MGENGAVTAVAGAGASASTDADAGRGGGASAKLRARAVDAMLAGIDAAAPVGIARAVSSNGTAGGALAERPTTRHDLVGVRARAATPG